MAITISWFKPMPSDPHSEYTKRLGARRASVAERDRRHRNIGNLRLLVFVIAGVLAWLAWGRGVLSPFWLALPLVMFVTLVVAHERVLRARKAAQRAVKHYEQALARLDGRWAGSGAAGERFLD